MLDIKKLIDPWNVQCLKARYGFRSRVEIIAMSLDSDGSRSYSLSRSNSRA